MNRVSSSALSALCVMGLAGCGGSSGSDKPAKAGPSPQTITVVVEPVVPAAATLISEPEFKLPVIATQPSPDPMGHTAATPPVVTYLPLAAAVVESDSHDGHGNRGSRPKPIAHVSAEESPDVDIDRTDLLSSGESPGTFVAALETKDERVADDIHLTDPPKVIGSRVPGDLGPPVVALAQPGLTIRPIIHTGIGRGGIGGGGQVTHGNVGYVTAPTGGTNGWFHEHDDQPMSHDADAWADTLAQGFPTPGQTGPQQIDIAAVEATIPEPTALGFLAIGIAALVIFISRRQPLDQQ